MSDTNDQFDLRSFANEQGDVRSVANEQPGQSNANEQSDQPAVVSAQHGRNDQSGRTYLKLVHSRSGHKTCISKHRDRINSIRSSYPVTDLAGLRISLAVIRETLTSIISATEQPYLELAGYRCSTITDRKSFAVP